MRRYTQVSGYRSGSDVVFEAEVDSLLLCLTELGCDGSVTGKHTSASLQGPQLLTTCCKALPYRDQPPEDGPHRLVVAGGCCMIGRASTR